MKIKCYLHKYFLFIFLLLVNGANDHCALKVLVLILSSVKLHFFFIGN